MRGLERPGASATLLPVVALVAGMVSLQSGAALAAACAEQGVAPERFEAFRPGQVWEG